MIDIGYNKIHLQGHSLGCTKIVYTYNRLVEENNTEILNKIGSVILLSLVDIVQTQKYSLNGKFDEMLEYALNKEKENNLFELMPQNAFIHPISVKSYLRYFKYNEKIDFSRYGNENYNFEELNNITVPIFMRWGNDKEMIIQDVNVLIKFMNNKINNIHKDISYIDGANHNYDGKELILATEIVNFLKNKN